MYDPPRLVAKSREKASVEVVVIGAHPCCALAASILAGQGVVVQRVVSAADSIRDRLVSISPLFFDLHPSLAATRKRLTQSPFRGARFLGDQPGTLGRYEPDAVSGYVAPLAEVSALLEADARKSAGAAINATALSVVGTDESSVELSVNGKTLKARMLIVGGDVPDSVRAALEIPASWEPGVLRRYSFARLRSAKLLGDDTVKTMFMSLDLAHRQSWAWMITSSDELQLAVEHSGNVAQGIELIRKWAEVLSAHGALRASSLGAITDESCSAIELPLAGALSQEGVARRTLLIGPAGGFYSACAEDVYPNCWSAVFAAEVAVSALKEKHLQDALQQYRGKWGSTLGDYLRGPQQNLKFLLPLVYRNPVMAARMGEAILLGSSVVR